MELTRRSLIVRGGMASGVLALGAASALATSPKTHKAKIVITGGHPGDPEYGCGGTIARYAEQGHEVVLLYLNDGVPAGKPRDGIRVAEARRACEILGGRPLFAGQVDGDAVVDRPHYGAFRELIEAERPDVVFTHW